MSFFSNSRGVFPGPIEGNANTGLRHRVAVNVERVLDSSLRQEVLENTPLALSGFSPPNPTTPYTFVSAVSSQTDAIVTNLSISRIEERPCFARIMCNLVIPIRVTLKDASDTVTTAESQITTTEDVVMYVPQASIFPFEIKAVASVNCPTGSYVDANTFNVTACTTRILRVVADTCLMIPAYGFCPSPPAVIFERETCADFYDLPLYPTGK